MTRPPAPTLAALLVLAAAPWPAARGQSLADCPGVGAPGLKVLLDDIQAEAGVPPLELDLLHERLRAALRNRLAELELELGLAQPIGLVRCPGRRPSDAAFTPPLVAALNARDVLLEVWGLTLARQGPDGTAVREALLHYAVLPVYQAAGNPPAVAGVYSVEHQIGATAPAADILALFQRAAELHAYSILGLGLKALELEETDQALRHLCRGVGMLEQALGATVPAAQGRLLAFVRHLVLETVAAARADPSGTSALALLAPRQAADPCAAGGVP